MLHLGTFDQKCLILVILGNKFRKDIAIFEVSILKFVYLQYFEKKTTMSKFGTKMSDLCILGLEIEINIVIFEISTLEYRKL